jgi:hypothetical protein
MQPVAYDEASNLQLLGRLAAPLRVVFALLCAIRILPLYRRFHSATGRGDPAALEAMAERLWGDIAGAQMSAEELKSAAEHSLSLVPSETDGWDEETQPFAEDAAAALAYAFLSLLTIMTPPISHDHDPGSRDPFDS